MASSPSKHVFTVVDDGMIVGVIEVGKFCDYCDKRTTCIMVDSLELPKSIEPRSTIWGRIMQRVDKRTEALPSTPLARHARIGIGCGCYAKFHRQVAHIQSKMRSRENARKRVESRKPREGG